MLVCLLFVVGSPVVPSVLIHAISLVTITTGIGKEIARLLAQQSDFETENVPWYIFLGCRDERRGRAAIDELAHDLNHAGGKLILCPLDITSPSSIQEAVKGIRDITGGQLDVLINNAAICFNDSTLYGKVKHTSFEEQADLTIRTNFYGTYSVIQAMLPLLETSESPRIINMGSSAGCLDILESDYLLESFTNPYLELQDLVSLMKEFVVDVQNGIHTYNGWPNSCYGASKLGIVAMTKVLARSHPEMMINSVDPGFCATDQNNGHGIRSAAEGAVAPFRLAILPHDNFVTGMNIEG